MAYSLRDFLYSPQNLQLNDPKLPKKFNLNDHLQEPVLPAIPRIFPPPADKANPFGNPPKPPHEVDPPERNPYNDLDYSPFIVTENLSGHGAKRSGAGGLLGMLSAMLMQAQPNPDAASASISESDSDDSTDPKAGLRNWMRELQMQQSQYQPASENDGQPIRYLGRRIARQ